MIGYDFDSSNDSFYLEYKKRPLQDSMKREHYHAAWELYFYLGDDMTFFVNDKSYNVKKYDLVFVDRFVYHKTRYKNDKKERILVMLRGEFFDMFGDKTAIYEYLLNIQNLTVLSFDEESKKIVYEKFLRIADYYENKKADKSELQIYFAELLATINHMINAKNVTVGMTHKSKNAMIISQITNYINNNYSEKITLDFLAEKCFIDKYHLCHIFRKETGMTIIDFINQKRMVEAGILLKSTDDSVFDISCNVGFQNQNYFGQLFKKLYGVSPREYRLKG